MDSTSENETLEVMNEDTSVEEDVEVVIEEGEVSAGGAQAKIKKLKAEIATLKKEKQEYLSGWQSARAELVNAKKRMEEEQKQRSGWANARLLEDFLPVADSFVMAMANKEVWEAVDKNWRTGIEYIYSQIQKVFGDHGLEPIQAEGQLFDANLHESIEERAAELADQDGIVAEVRQVGYTLNGKVLRPAKVIVYHYQQD